MKRKKQTRKLLLRALMLAVVLTAGVLSYQSFFQPDVKPKLKPTPVASTPDTRNQIRRDVLNQLSYALKQYKSDHGKLPVVLGASDRGICTNFGAACNKVKLVDLNFLVANGDYVDNIMSDPFGGKGKWNTGFTIAQLSDGRIRLSAPNAENGAKISVVR